MLLVLPRPTTSIIGASLVHDIGLDRVVASMALQNGHILAVERTEIERHGKVEVSFGAAVNKETWRYIVGLETTESSYALQCGNDQAWVPMLQPPLVADACAASD